MHKQSAEFDAYAEEYRRMLDEAVEGSGDNSAYFAEYKIKDIFSDRERRQKDSGTELTCIDFGAGIGSSEPYLRKYFPKSRIIALDVSEKSIEINSSANGDIAEYHLYDGTNIQLEDNSVDFVIAACVFHHIEHDHHVALLKEIRRILKPAGDLYVFEHNPWNPLTLRIVNTCEFDENAELIIAPEMKRRFKAAGFLTAGPIYRYFFPAQLKFLRPLERLFRWLPIGGQYYVRGTK